MGFGLRYRKTLPTLPYQMAWVNVAGSTGLPASLRTSHYRPCASPRVPVRVRHAPTRRRGRAKCRVLATTYHCSPKGVPSLLLTHILYHKTPKKSIENGKKNKKLFRRNTSKSTNKRKEGYHPLLSLNLRAMMSNRNPFS